MSKKRSLKTDALQADFWTALPIDECRERLTELQKAEGHGRSEPEPQRGLAESAVAPARNTFQFTRFHPLTFRERLVQEGRRRYRVDLIVQLHPTVDGTHVIIELASTTQSNLRSDILITQINIAASIGLILLLLGLAVIQIVRLYLGITINELGDLGQGTGLESVIFFVPIFSVGVTLIMLFLGEWWSKFQGLTTTAPTVLAKIRDELYVASSGQ